jgi:excisionase family DNA binding protein
MSRTTFVDSTQLISENTSSIGPTIGPKNLGCYNYSPMGTDVEILTIDEVAAWLKISKRAVYELTSERGRTRMKHPLPVLRINSTIRFIKSDVAEWIEKLAARGR